VRGITLAALRGDDCVADRHVRATSITLGLTLAAAAAESFMRAHLHALMSANTPRCVVFITERAPPSHHTHTCLSSISFASLLLSSRATRSASSLSLDRLDTCRQPCKLWFNGWISSLTLSTLSHTVCQQSLLIT
jgi:hypothetical protein